MKSHFQIALFCLISIYANAQDLEPRFLSSSPTGTNFSGLAYGYSTGNILLNGLEVENLNAKINTFIPFYGRSFKLFNKLAKTSIAVPYSVAKFNALVSDVDTTAYRNGFNDVSFKMSMILIGDQVSPLKEFTKRKQRKFKLGTAFKIKVPLGRYDETKLLNLGANRWAFQFKVASSYAFTKKLLLELHVESWFFTENSSYFNGNTLKQKPLLSTQLHVIYLFGPKFWTSVSVGQVAWGDTSINGVAKNNSQKNSKYGASISYKVGKQSSLKASITNGLYTGRGADFTSALVAYSFIWFDKK